MRSRAASPCGPSWPRCMASRKDAAAAAAVRCISSTPRPASMAATRSSAAACRSPSDWRWLTACSAGRTSPPASSAKGAVAEGEFHESLNLAALWQLPVLFVCENNLYAMGTALARSESETDIHRKAAELSRAGGGRRRHGRRSPWKPRQVAPSQRCGREAGRASWSAAPTASGPTRCSTPELYRDEGRSGAVATARPDPHLIGWMREAAALHDSDLAALEAEIAAEIEGAIAFAEQGSWEPIEDLTRDVYAPVQP